MKRLYFRILTRNADRLGSCSLQGGRKKVKDYSREGQVILPDRPTEYSCRYTSNADGTTVTFENQNGWRFMVKLGASDEGEWTATSEQNLYRNAGRTRTGACLSRLSTPAGPARRGTPNFFIRYWRAGAYWLAASAI
jgi:hypothetical protein